MNNKIHQIADVKIMLEQIKHLLLKTNYADANLPKGIEHELSECKSEKIDRQLKRIQKEVKNMDKTNKLAKLLVENPNVRIIPMISENVKLSNNYTYTCGDIENCELIQITQLEERIYLIDEREELIDFLLEFNGRCTDELSANKYIQDELGWETVILLYINHKS